MLSKHLRLALFSATMPWMKKILIYSFLIVFISTLTGFFVWWQGSQEEKMASPYFKNQNDQSVEKPLLKYTFVNLKKRQPQVSPIQLEENIPAGSVLAQGYKSYIFSYFSDGRKVSGLANIPEAEPEASTSADLSVEVEVEDSSPSAIQSKSNLDISSTQDDQKYPVIVLVRGYVDQADYEPGAGTKRVGEYFAQNGFITLAPDFLGYGGSDMPPDNVWEERFLRPLAVIDLLASVSALPQADSSHIFIWGHSNGGMVSMAVLELTGGDYPTVLWAPVSQSFPYDVLYYTYEFEDKGKALRQALADFEKDYSVDNFSFDNHLDWINAPIQLEQGKDDQYVPLAWTSNLNVKLKNLGKEVNFYSYSGTDHNMNGAWDKAIARDLAFFQSYL